MGFKPSRKVFVLEFRDSDLEGLEIRAHCAQLWVGDLDTDTEMAKAFAEYLISWNLDHPITGEPVPATAEGVASLPFDTMLPILRAWCRSWREVPAPLDQRSSGGEQSAAPPIPMEPLSDARAS